MKIMLIGDPHVEVSKILEMERLFDFIEQQIHTLTPDTMLLLGDLFDTNSVLRQEVIEFYKRRLAQIKRKYPTIKLLSLVGNHDLVGPKNNQYDAVSLCLSDSLDLVINTPTTWSGLLFCPYTPDKEDLVRFSQLSPKDSILFCHGTFDTAKNENGFYAPDGLDLNRINQDFVISGHIHTEQEIRTNDKFLYYPGTAYPRKSSEVNQDKFIALVDTNTKVIQKISTRPATKRFWQIDIKNGDEDLSLSGQFIEGDSVKVNVHGDETFVNEYIKSNRDSYKNYKFIPKVIKTLSNKRIDMDDEKVDLVSAMKNYIFDISDVRPELKEVVWKKITEKTIT